MKVIIQSILGAILAFFMMRYTKCGRTILFGLLFFCMLETYRLLESNRLLEGMTADKPGGINQIKTDLANYCSNIFKGEFTFNDDTQLFTYKLGEIPKDEEVKYISEISNYDKPSNTISSSLYNAAMNTCKQFQGSPGIVDGKFTCSEIESPNIFIQGYGEYYGGTYDEKNKRSIFPQIIVPSAVVPADPVANTTLPAAPVANTTLPVAPVANTTLPAAPADMASNLESDCYNSSGNWIFDSERRQGICIYENI